MLLELVFAGKLIDLDLLSFQLGLFGRIVDLQPFFIDFVLSAELLGFDLGDLGIGVGQKAFLREGGVAVGLQLGGIVIGAGLGGGGAQIEEGLMECDLEILVIGPGCLQGKLGVEKRRLEFRAGEDHHHRIGFHRRAGLDQNPFHAAIGGGRYEHGVFRDQGAETVDLADHGAALHGVRPER